MEWLNYHHLLYVWVVAKQGSIARATEELGLAHPTGASLALFGSVVRDEATSASDVDLLVEFDGRPIGLFHLSRTQHYLETVLGVPRVDLVLRDAVKPALRDKILREAVCAM